MCTINVTLSPYFILFIIPKEVYVLYIIIEHRHPWFLKIVLENGTSLANEECYFCIVCYVSLKHHYHMQTKHVAIK